MSRLDVRKPARTRLRQSFLLLYNNTNTYLMTCSHQCSVKATTIVYYQLVPRCRPVQLASTRSMNRQRSGLGSRSIVAVPRHRAAERRRTDRPTMCQRPGFTGEYAATRNQTNHLHGVIRYHYARTAWELRPDHHHRHIARPSLTTPTDSVDMTTRRDIFQSP